MTFQQAKAIWNSSPTVAKGVLVHALSNSCRLFRYDDHTFIIRHRSCDIITIRDDNTYVLSQGDEMRYKFARRNLINRYLPTAAYLNSFRNGMTIRIPQERAQR